MRRTLPLFFLLSFFSLAGIAQSFESYHSTRFGDELNYAGLSTDERSVNGVIPLYDSIICYHYFLFRDDLQLYSMDKNFIFDAQNNKLSTDHFFYYNNQWHLEYQSFFTYNIANQITRNTLLNTNTQDSISDNIYEYDDNGNRTLAIIKNLGIDNFLSIQDREVNIYDENSNILSRTIERGNSWDDTLSYYTKENYTYENNKLSIYFKLRWANGDWVNDFKHIYSYGANGMLSEVLILIMESGNWTDSNKYSYSYDTAGNLSSIAGLSYYQGSWRNSSKTGYTYVADKKLTEVYEYWTDGEWVNFFNVYNYYDANLNMTYHECYELVEGVFVLADYQRSEFDDDNIMTNNAYYRFDTWVVPSVLSSSDSTLYYFRKVVGLDEKDKTMPVTIYPNPTSGLVKIDAASPILRTELYNLSGEHIMTLWAKSNIIDLSSHPKGVYLVKVITQKDVYVRKVIVQ